jgi:hypothetical protein
MSSVSLAVPARSATVGLWPRLGALVLDLVVVIVAVQLLTTAVHYASRGEVQGALGLAFVDCQPTRDVPKLDPPPPQGYSFVMHCQRSLLGLDMANWLAIGKVVSLGDGHFDKQVQQYAIGPQGDQAFAPTIAGDGWIVFAIFAYLPIADWLFGATVGKWIVGLRTIDVRNPSRRGLPFWKAVVRQAAIQAGILLSTAIIFVYQLAGADLEQSTDLARLLYLVVLGWILWNSGRLLVGWESLYDRAAGTTVVRREF